MHKEGLPSNYSFELDKTVRRINQLGAQRVALQFPEGLLVFSVAVADALKRQASVTEFAILGDVTYGACCVDDTTAAALGCDLLVHYGHSCLINVKQCKIPMMYVFVEIAIDMHHCIETVRRHVPSDSTVAIVGVVQYLTAVRTLLNCLKEHFARQPVLPQVKPLSRGEILGCTSPCLKLFDTLIFIGDGRFHLESCLIANPHLVAYQYNPYHKVLTREKHDIKELHSKRREAIEVSAKAHSLGLILGTLGRQGSTSLLNRIRYLAKKQNYKITIYLMSEIFPSTLRKLADIDAFVQIACPRLSIDWGKQFPKPLLTPYEAEVLFQTTTYRQNYPMEHYSRDGALWSVYGAKQ